jgi:predicted nucleic acid-binding protein
MADILLDTNILSFGLKDDTRRSLYEPHVAGNRAFLCFVTVAELYRWAITKRWGQRRVDAPNEEIRRHVVLPFDDALAWAWARVRTIKGRPVDPSDAWIAATAIRYNLPLVTHNRRHFDGITGLQVISEG